jgi:hypothetical protein
MRLAEILAELDSMETRRLELYEARKAAYQRRRIPCAKCKVRSPAKHWTRLYHYRYEESGHNGDWHCLRGRRIACPKCQAEHTLTEQPREFGVMSIPDESFVSKKHIYDR